VYDSLVHLDQLGFQCRDSSRGVDDGARLRRPEGGYRATIVGGVPVQLDGTLTGSLLGRVISSSD
jgi:N-acyl-D-aspartate/D-glutamate deacylase